MLLARRLRVRRFLGCLVQLLDGCDASQSYVWPFIVVSTLQGKSQTQDTGDVDERLETQDEEAAQEVGE